MGPAAAGAAGRGAGPGRTGSSVGGVRAAGAAARQWAFGELGCEAYSASVHYLRTDGKSGPVGAAGCGHPLPVNGRRIRDGGGDVGFRAAWALGRFWRAGLASERVEREQLYLGHRGRRAAGRVRAGQVPGRDPADDGDSAAGRGAGADEGSGPADEGPAGRRRHHEPRRGAAAGGRRSVLQRVALPAARPHVAGNAAAVAGGLRGVPGRLFAERPGGAGEIQVPQPDSDAGGSGRAGLPAGEVPGQFDQPRSATVCSTGTDRCGWTAWTTTGWERSSRS